MARLARLASPIFLALAFATLGEAASIDAESAAPGDSGKHVSPSFDILGADIIRYEEGVIFRMRVRGDAGKEKPSPAGDLRGSKVFAYAWPTTLNSDAVGFPPDQGIVALAVTFHPDFDDEVGAENRDRWHAHWLVIEKDAACDGAYKVKDALAEGENRTLPVMMSTPELPVRVEGEIVETIVPTMALHAIAGTNFDGMTMQLQVNSTSTKPALCVTTLYDTASHDFSLPGEVE